MTDIPRYLRGPKDNLGQKLFKPGFSDCKLYRRQTAFFQPSVFKGWAQSIEEIVENETKLEILMAFTESNSKILNTIAGLESKEQKEKLIEQEAKTIFLKCLELVASSEDYKNRARLIRYLYAKELLEIKLAVSFHPEKDEYALSHEKTGYFLQNDGTYVVFHGSANESESAQLRQGENLIVWHSKDEKDKEDVEHFKNDLDSKWEGKDIYCKIFLPTDELILKIKNSNKIGKKSEALEIAKEIAEAEKEEVPMTPRKYQEEAIKNWWAQGQVGILDHATGSGKTFTALRAAQALRDDQKQLTIVIGVPFIPLAEQWMYEVDNYFKVISNNNFEFNGAIGCFSNQPRYSTQIKKESARFYKSLTRGKGHLSVYIVVNKTLSTDEFQKYFQDSEYFLPEQLLFIGDECHNYANANLLTKLNLLSRFRLGLSATAFDDEYNKSSDEKEMENYFGEICHRYSLKDGIDDGYLSKYTYHPKLCYLEPDEFRKWKDYLDKYENFTNYKEADPNNKAFKRMEDVIDSCKDKYIEFNQLIKKIDEKEYAIIFSGQEKVDGERCIDFVARNLEKNNWRSQRITAEETPKERRNTIYGFQRGDIQSICAIRVLDEGIDIPAIKKAIILASSKKRRQFIQRRGRVLRRDDDKDLAVIYDFIIVPPASFTEQGKVLIEREMGRVEEMGQDAENKKEIEDFMKSYRGLYEPV